MQKDGVNNVVKGLRSSMEPGRVCTNEMPEACGNICCPRDLVKLLKVLLSETRTHNHSSSI